MKYFRDLKDLKNKRVLLRVDFNVDFDDKGNVVDDFRIVSALPSIKYLMENGAKIIIISHLGRPKQGDAEGNKKYSLRPVAGYLKKLLNNDVKFIDDCVGDRVKLAVVDMKEGEIVMLENLRFYGGEEKDDKDFAKSLAELGDIYVNDAFGVSHRANASVSAITEFLPSYCGLLLEKEIIELSKLLEKRESPCVLVLGGAKIETKLPVMKFWLDKADKILIGGAIANVFLKIFGFKIGKSLYEPGYDEDVRNINKNKKVIFPQDVITEAGIKGINEVGENDKIFDLGPKTIDDFAKIIKQAKTVVWNGPIGLIEDERFFAGSRGVAEAIAGNSNFTVVGGGETLIILKKLGLFEKIKFVSTGGGAMLEFMAGKKLPGIEALNHFNE